MNKERFIFKHVISGKIIELISKSVAPCSERSKLYFEAYRYKTIKYSNDSQNVQYRVHGAVSREGLDRYYTRLTDIDIKLFNL